MASPLVVVGVDVAMVYCRRFGWAGWVGLWDFQGRYFPIEIARKVT
jgi:hypothetical protein